MSSTRTQTADLGSPLPDSPHAVSVSLPSWEDNIGYEEADPRVMDQLRTGYPRFVLHRLVRHLFDQTARALHHDPRGCFVFPSPTVADRAATYCRHHGADQASVHLQPRGVAAVTVDPQHRELLMQYWQHSGEIISSRRAEQLLDDAGTSDATDSERQDLINQIRTRVGSVSGAAPEDVYVFPTGMAAVFCAYRTMQACRPGTTVQFGFPYVDILKIQQRFGYPVEFFPRGLDEDLERVADVVQREHCSGIITEFPGNPLLTSPDLSRLSGLTAAANVPLLIDDTLAAVTNLELLPHCDFLATSLTKYFSGTGDVMGGSLVLNPQRPQYAQLKATLDSLYEDLNFVPDLQCLEQNSRDVESRVARINQTALALCERLRSHPAVRALHYPAWVSRERYAAHRRPQGGWGGLFSMELHDEQTCAPRFFDALQISKGPNLGTNFSLCCPYTILAHYHELDFARECGISPYLIRVSVGLEPVEELTRSFWDALEATRA